MGFISSLATKASAYIGTAVTYIGAGLAIASQYAPFVLPLLSPKTQVTLGAALVAVGHFQTLLSSSVLPAVNSVASAAQSVGLSKNSVAK
jgi:hypothetical protein